MSLFYRSSDEFDSPQTIEEAICTYLWMQAYIKTTSNEILTLDERTTVKHKDKKAAHDHKVELMYQEIKKLITPKIIELLNKDADEVFLKYFPERNHNPFLESK